MYGCRQCPHLSTTQHFLCLAHCSLRAVEDLMPLVGQAGPASGSKAGGGSSSGTPLTKALGWMRQLPDLERLLAR